MSLALLLSLAVFGAPDDGPGATSTTTSSTIAKAIAVLEPEAWVSVRDRKVFLVRVSRNGQPPSARAREAAKALEAVVADANSPEDTKVLADGEHWIIYVGESPIIQVATADADAAGDASAEVHARRIATQIHTAVHAERTRSEVAKTVFSISLLVFSGLLVFLLLRRVGQLADFSQKTLEARKDPLPALAFSGIEVLSPATVMASVSTGISIGARLAQIAFVYLWILLSLSLFERTRDDSERLSELIVKPLGQLVARLGGALPLFLLLVVAILGLAVLIRFTGLFFRSVGKGETKLSWLSSDLAGPTSVLVRGLMILLFLVLAAPLLFGTSDAVPAMAGIIALAAVGLAAAPLLASALVGVVIIFGHRHRAGDWIELGSISGRIRTLNLFEMRLEDAEGREIRVPNLRALFESIEVHGRTLRVSVLVPIDPKAPLLEIEPMLLEIASTLGERPSVCLEHLDADAAHFRISVSAAEAPKTRTALLARIAERLRASGHALGRASGPRP